MNEMTRCAWAGDDSLMQAYHDAEWGVPVRDARTLWEMLMLEGFQAGLSWRTILHRREGFRRAFAGFDPVKVAAFGPADVERLMADEGIIRARAKIEATIGAARIYCAMAEAGEDFSDWLWGLAGGAPQVNDGVRVPAQTPVSEAMSKALKAKGFKFVGPVIVYAFMQAVGMVNDHAPECFRR
ncbi:MAG: DNA-3-methyladenine glycosylase I [Sphingomonas sp.]|uniref:DNA-3-methyladenine glycosylase I n=1 Tax=Sphingomonas sp. TaxID=28214 RepID=UPI0025D02527|nr:DNA-3-methyladenine glycosylase I [Sphingomonas sp.]MBX3564883.1 DNA-3-methyladenine glycosylase I [Sphingomonas sp.]